MDTRYYTKHIFICTNIKKEGKCCGGIEVSHAFLKELKDIVTQHRLKGPGGIRISSSGCMGRCDEGPIGVVYPEGQWFHIDKQADRETLCNAIIRGE